MKHLPDIQYKTIPHKSQRYETVGDYFEDKYMGGKDRVNFRVSSMKSEYEFLVFIHEAIEWFLSKKEGVDLKDIDAFDIEFEKSREKGNYDEPGDDKSAPYHDQHMFATKIERLLAKRLKVDWDEYDKAIISL